MNQPVKTSDSRALALFAPLALSVVVLISTLYFSTRQAPARHQSRNPTPPEMLGWGPRANGPEDSIPRTTAAGGSFTDAEFARHIDALKKKIPAKEFTISIQSPFVVIGDSPPADVRSQAETVRWAVEKLKQEYFAKDPAQILDIWLFKNAASYKKYARELFNDEPSTPYGYYSSTHKALVMNIATGGGTLVHEIVHPFVEANFPGCPPWLNEGLGSLYEQSGEEDGHIHGYPNWRLPGLQRAIRAGVVPPFKTLMAMDVDGFYNKDKGTNYGQARYLCYYLQEKGLLQKFYKEFSARGKEDPTGYQTLQSILGERDMAAFQKRWEKFVLGLSEGYSVRVTD